MPLVALVPVQLPVAVQLVALVEDQVRVDELPVVIEVGDAEIVTVGAGVGVVPTATLALALAVPPAPVHAMV